jgi:hypothetical protein
MYFEDIFNKVAVLWKTEYLIYNLEETETYIESLKDEFLRIENVMAENSSDFSDWEAMLNFTIYKALTGHAIKRCISEGVDKIYFNDLSLEDFEHVFLENLQDKVNKKYHKLYKGFRNIK